MTRPYSSRFSLTIAALVVVAAVTTAHGQAPPVAASEATDAQAPAARDEEGSAEGSTNGLRIPNGIVQVQFRSPSGAAEPDWIQGVVVTGTEGEQKRYYMVLPWSNRWFDAEQRVEFAQDREKMREWFASVFNGATVNNGATDRTLGWWGTAEFVDYQPLLQLALLQLGESESFPSPSPLSEAAKFDRQQVFVHEHFHRVQGQLAVPYPMDTFPWRIKLDGAPIDARTAKPDEAKQMATGAAVATPEGELIGLITDLKTTRPGAPVGEGAVLIPASYIDALLRIQHPGVSGELDTLVIGMAMGKERALIESPPMRWGEPFAPTQPGERPSTSAPVDAAGPPSAAPPDTPARARTSSASSVPEPEVQIYTLQHLTPNEAVFVLSRMFGEQVRASATPNQGGMIAAGAPGDLQQVDSLLRVLDQEPPADWPGKEELFTNWGVNVSVDQQVAEIGGWLQQRNPWIPRPEGEIRVYPLQHVAPRPVVDLLVSLFGMAEARGDEDEVPTRRSPIFAFVPTQPALLVRGNSQEMQQIEAIIERLDEPSAGQEAAGTTATAPSDATEGRTSDESVKVVVYALGNRSADAVTADLQRLKPTMVPTVNFSVRAVNDRTIEITGSGRAQRYIGAMIESLDVEQNGATGSVDVFVANSAETEPLRIAYAEQNARLRALAEEARRAAAGNGERVAPDQQTALRQAVAEAFEVRQQLQRAELGVLETKIAAMRRTLEAREQIKDQIIQRRVEELLNPALEWDTSGRTGQPDREVGAALGPAPIVATPTGLAGAPYRATGNGVQGRAITMPAEATTERLYQGKTESQWKRLFSAETDAVAKLDAAIALLNLSAPLTQEQQFERVLDVGSELVQWKYREPLEFAFESLPPQRWSILGDEQRKAYLRFHSEVLRICESLPAAVLAAELADALDSTAAPRAAFGLSLLTYTVRTRVAGDAQASRLLLERLGRIDPAAGDDFAFLKLFAKVYVSASANDEELATLADEIVAACQAVRTGSTPAAGFEFPPRYWLISLPLPDALLQDPRVTRALAEVIADDVVVHGRMTAHILQTHLSLPPTATDLQSQVDAVRSTCGPALPGWLSVANDHLQRHHAPPFTEADRAMLQGTYRAINLYSDGDEWPAAETAELLTELLRAAYTDDPAATVDQPVSELLPTSPLRLLSSIVTTTGAIPDFVKTGRPRSTEVAEKLAALDQLLAGEVTGRRIDELTDKVSGLLGEAPVETVQRLIAASTRTEANMFLGAGNQRLEYMLSSSSILNAEAPKPLAGSGFGGGVFFGNPTPSRQPIDALLLLAILAEMAGADRDQDARIATLEAVDVGGVFRWQIQNLLASNLQTRQHAARMLREMAAKTESPELLEMIRAIDPAAVAAVP